MDLTFVQKKTNYLLFLILLVGIILSGCTINTENNERENNVNTQQDIVVQPGSGDLKFSVPSELPIAYVGKPYLYSMCDPQATQSSDYEYAAYSCGNNVTSINPKGGTPPYTVELNQANYDNTKWSIYTMSPHGGIINFTPQLRDAGQYVFEFCATDSGDNYDKPVCKNTTLYIMSDIVTVKGEGELTHHLLVKLNSDVAAGGGSEVKKDILTGYLPTANFSPVKVIAEVPAKPSSCTYNCEGGSRAEFIATANAVSVSSSAEGSAACGKALGPNYPGDYWVDYYHTGFVGYTENIYIALNITNTGTKEKAVDIYLNISSEVDPKSQNYYGSATANAIACIGDDCIEVPNAMPGNVILNSTVLRVLIRPGNHQIYVGSMNDRVDNTNMLSCPSFVKASSSVSVTIISADMNDGKKAIGSIYSYHTQYQSGSDVMSLGFS